MTLLSESDHVRHISNSFVTNFFADQIQSEKVKSKQKNLVSILKKAGYLQIFGWFRHEKHYEITNFSSEKCVKVKW